MKLPFFTVFSLFLFSCSSHPTVLSERVWLDSSTHSGDRPEWTEGLKRIWEEDEKVFIRSSQTVRGDERVSGCFELAKMDAQETVIEEHASQVKGSTDSAFQSIDENAQILLGKVRTGEYQGRIAGLRHSEQYFERYRVGGVERIDCYILSEIGKNDYDKIRETVFTVKPVESRLQEAVTRKHADFFENSEKAKAILKSLD